MAVSPSTCMTVRLSKLICNNARRQSLYSWKKIISLDKLKSSKHFVRTFTGMTYGMASCVLKGQMRIVSPQICCSFSSQRHKPRGKQYFYNVLKVTPKATQKDIKESYYSLSKLYHPDLNKDPDARTIFAQISEAYEILGDPKSRHLYDRGILNPRHFTETDYPDSFRDQEGFAARKDKPPTGHTKIYNFDEFYRMHYGETRKRRDKGEAARQRRDEQYEEVYKQRVTIALFMGLSGFCLTIIYFLYLASPVERRR